MTDDSGSTKTKVFLQITHDGNFGGNKPSDGYFQTAEIEAIPGTYRLDELECGGFYNMSRISFEIVSVHARTVLLHINSKDYTVTSDSPVEITQTDTDTTYDGPHFTAYDTLEFRGLLQ